MWVYRPLYCILECIGRLDQGHVEILPLAQCHLTQALFFCQFVHDSGVDCSASSNDRLDVGDPIVIGLECVGLAVFGTDLAKIVAHQQQPHLKSGASARLGQVGDFVVGGVKSVDVFGGNFGVVGTHA